MFLTRLHQDRRRLLLATNVDLATQLVAGLAALALAAVGFIVHGIRNDIASLKEAHIKTEDTIAESGDRLQTQISELNTKVEVLIDRNGRSRRHEQR